MGRRKLEFNKSFLKKHAFLLYGRRQDGAHLFFKGDGYIRRGIESYLKYAYGIEITEDNVVSMSVGKDMFTGLLLTQHEAIEDLSKTISTYHRAHYTGKGIEQMFRILGHTHGDFAPPENSFARKTYAQIDKNIKQWGVLVKGNATTALVIAGGPQTSPQTVKRYFETTHNISPHPIRTGRGVTVEFTEDKEAEILTKLRQMVPPDKHIILDPGELMQDGIGLALQQAPTFIREK